MLADLTRSILSQITLIVPGFLVVMVIISILSLRFKRIIILHVFASILLLTASSAFTKNLVVNSIEQKYQQLLEAPSDVTHILVLSAGHSGNKNTPAINQLNPSSLSRLVEAVRLWRQIPHAYLIVTGDKGLNLNLNTQSYAVKESAIWMGVNHDKIISLPNVSNTEQETSSAAKLVGSGKLIVVTSAIHLPRALSHLKNIDIEYLGAPTHYMGTNNAPWWNFGASNLLHIDRALHEIVGSLWLTIRTFVPTR